MSHDDSDADSLHVEVETATDLVKYIDIECYAGAGGLFLGGVRVDANATVGQLKARLPQKGWLPAPPYRLLIGGLQINPDDDYMCFPNTSECRKERSLVLNIVQISAASRLLSKEGMS